MRCCSRHFATSSSSEINGSRKFEALSVAIEQFLARSPSALMMANLSDMLGEAVQLNVPGTVSEHPNWRYRLRLPISALATSPWFAVSRHAWSRNGSGLLPRHTERFVATS